jgi:hypothetical protein
MATTKNAASVHYNLALLGKAQYAAAPLFSAGKYVCIVKNPGEEQPEITFFDFRANRNNVKEILGSENYSTEFKTRFTSLAEAVNADYEYHADEVELVLGASPNE